MGAKATPATLGLSVLTTQPPASVTHAEVAPMAFMEMEPFAEVRFLRSGFYANNFHAFYFVRFKVFFNL